MLALHALAGMALLLSSLPWWLQGTLGVAWCLSLATAVRDWRQWLRPARVLGLLQRESGWQVVLSDGVHPAELLPGVFVTPWVMVLRLRSSNKVLRCVLWPDSTMADDLRRLRVLLLTSGMVVPEKA